MRSSIGTESKPPHVFDPVAQIAAFAVLDLEEVGSLVEVPVEDLCDVVPVAERLLEQPEEHHLSAQAVEPLGFEAELEDA